MNENDPTQPGGQQDEEIKPTNNPRNAALAQIAEQTHKDGAADLASFNEETGEIAQGAAPVVVAEPEEVAAPVVVAPVAPVAPKMLTIIVDGQPIEVEESRILEAGKRTLQKDQAADRRLQEATQTKREYERLLAQTQQRLSAQDAGSYDNPVPSQDAQQPSQTAINPEDRPLTRAELKIALFAEKADDAATKFFEEYPEIASDPDLLAMAARREEARLRLAESLGEPPGDPYKAYRAHGEAVRKWLEEKRGPAPAPTLAISDKAERKRNIVAIPAINARTPAPTPPKVLTSSEQIDAIREARKQGRPVHQRN